jgi:hypothetical protein
MAEIDVLRHLSVLSCVSGGSIVGACYWLMLRERLRAKEVLSRDDYVTLVKRLIRHFGEAVEANLRGEIQPSKAHVAWRLLQDQRGALDPERAAQHLNTYFYEPLTANLWSPGATRVDALTQRKAAVIRGRIAATVSRRVPQVMVKVTGGGRGMAAIAAHFRYISKNGRLDIEDDRGVVSNGKEAVHDLVERWRFGGSFIDEVSPRREAFNIMLSMPQGPDPRIVLQAAREFAQVELHRWRETFAEKLRGWGVEAKAREAGDARREPQVGSAWRVKAREAGRLLRDDSTDKSGGHYRLSRGGALEAWTHIAHALGASDRLEDRKLSGEVERFVRESSAVREWVAARQRDGRMPVDVSTRRDTRDRGPENSR